MPAFRVQEAASYRIDEIFQYTSERWGHLQAEAYVTGLFEAFGKISTHEIRSRPIPAELGVDGFFFRYEKHVVYWKRLGDGDVGIVTVLHQRMHQTQRIREDLHL